MTEATCVVEHGDWTGPHARISSCPTGAQRTFEIETTITVTLEGDGAAALQLVDETLQRAWDTDRGRHHVNRDWHFEILDGAIVTELDDNGNVVEPGDDDG